PMTHPVKVPADLLSQYHRVVRLAKQMDDEPDLFKLAVAEGMALPDFADIHVTQTSLESAQHTSQATPGFTRAEAHIAAHQALAVITDRQRDICKWSYGFNTNGAPLSDAAVVQLWSVAALGEEAVYAGQTVATRPT